ncbi:MAG: TonB-dependent receptor [Alphaproteobacteria bacterium]
MSLGATGASRRRHLCLAIAISAFAFAQTAAFAAESEVAEAELVIVTAQKRAAELKNVPFSVNAQTEADIQRTGSQNIEDLARNVASLIVQNLGPGQSQVAVRSIAAGQTVRDQPGVKEQVGVYLDESVLSLSLFTPDIELFDLNRVETLRGPQGTLFGAGSIGGTIRYITNQPVLGETGGIAEAGASTASGDYGYTAKAAYNVPLGDTAAVRAVGYFNHYPGFIDAFMEGGGKKDNVNDGDKFGGRLALRFEPSPNFSITPRVVYQKVDTDGFNRQEIYNMYRNPYTTTRPPYKFKEREQHLLRDEEFVDEFFLADAVIEALFDGVAFTSVSSYIDRDILVSRDASALSHSVTMDLIAAGLFLPGAIAITAVPSNLRDTTSLKSFTQEARLASADDGPLQWLVGVFYADVERDYAQRLPTPGYDAVIDAGLGMGTAVALRNGFNLADQPYMADVPYDIEQFAVFGEATYDVTSDLHATAGVRWYDFEENRRFHSGGLFSNTDDRTDQTKSQGWSPRFILSYDVDEATRINAQASKGFRLGGVNDPLNVNLCTPEDLAIFGAFQSYEDETLWNYEVGLKIAQRAFSFNAAVFHADIENLQVTLDAGTCSSRIVFNLPEAHSTGVEAELVASLTDDLVVSITGSYIDAKFDSTVVDGTGAVVAGLREGNRMASVPEYQFAATGTYNFDLFEQQSYFSVSVQHVGSRFTQPADQEDNPRAFVHGLAFGGAPLAATTVVDLELDPYTIVNTNLGINFENYELVLYVNNVFDENANLAFDRERGGRARLGFHTNPPRTFGFVVRTGL